MRVGEKPMSINRTDRLRNTLADILAAVESNNASPPRNKVDQAFEGGLHSKQIGIDIRMIELNMRKNQGVGKVVQELWPLVEERGVVLIPLEEKRPRGPHHKAGTEVFRHAPDEK